jgi:hypothetical protein
MAIAIVMDAKKGMSALQLKEHLGIGSYRTAWYMVHRIRKAMVDLFPTKLSGIVEVDETYIGRLKDQPVRRGGSTHKNAVLTLVERGGSARSFHVDGTSIADIAPILKANIAKESGLMTDEARHYMEPGRDFASHEAVNHSEKEYVRYWNEVTNKTRPDGKPIVETTTITTNTVEGYYSIFKRGMKGVYQHCSEKHLHRYLAEFDFRYSNRSKLGIEDCERSDKAIMGSGGKRLMYQQPHEAANT